MNKRLLRALPIRLASDNDIKMAQKIKNINIKNKKTRDKKIKFLVSAEVVKINKEKVLTVTIFDLKKLSDGKKEPEYKLFLTRENYITANFIGDKLKWKTGSLGRILDISYWCGYGNCRWSEVEILDKKSEEELRKYLNKSEKYLDEIDKIQYNIMKKRLKEKHKKITDPIDEEMNKVSELPNDFKKWINDVAFYDSKYMYYEYTNKKLKYGYCTHCNKEVRIEKPRHNKEGICPNCKEKIIYKSLGKSKYINDHGNAAIIQKLSDGRIILREFSIKKSYNDHYKNPEISYWEIRRVIWNDRTYKIYEWTDFRQTGNRWCNSEMTVNINREVLYERNLDVLQDTEWKYSTIKEFSTNSKGYKINVFFYMYHYLRYPFLEYLIKTQLYGIAHDITDGLYEYKSNMLNTSARSLHDILKVKRNDISLLQRLNANCNILEIIQDISKDNIKISEDEIKYIAKNSVWDITKELYKYISIRKIIRYIDTQLKEENINLTMRSYRDYLRECEDLKFDMKNEFILFPKDLKSRHAETTAMYKAKKNEINDNKLKMINEELYNIYGWEDDKYKIIIPHNSEQLIKEGQALHHCVASYVDNMANRKTTIIFIRKKSNIEKSFYTMEIVDNKIIQCRTMGNYSYESSKTMIKVIKKYEKQVLIPLRNRNEKLGIKIGA